VLGTLGCTGNSVVAGARAAGALDGGFDAPTFEDRARAPEVTAPRDVVVVEGRACTVNADCAEADFCENATGCIQGHCVELGGAPNCDDGIACTTDYCFPGPYGCVHEVYDNFGNINCDAGLLCSPIAGCVRELPCAAGGERVCAQLDLDACLGLGRCDLARGRCVPGPPFDCDDHDPETKDFCYLDHAEARCEHIRPP
jgi:hypothetical protein